MDVDWGALAENEQHEMLAELLSQGLDLKALAEKPFQEIEQRDDVSIRVGEPQRDTCTGGGYYDADQKTIHIHPKSWRRNNFTLLHEFGHHLLDSSDGWVWEGLPRLSKDKVRRVEERVCDVFAARVLLPPDGDRLDAYYSRPAQVMAALFADSAASRSAVLQHVRRLLPTNARFILAVAELNGTVVTSHSTYSDSPPAKGSYQPGFRALAAQAADKPAIRPLHEGLHYQTGIVLHDMLAEAVLDYYGRHVFVALKPENRFGTGSVAPAVADCPNPACSEEFEVNQSPGACESCQSHRCPACNSCNCSETNLGATCPDCFVTMSPLEVANGTHEC